MASQKKSDKEPAEKQDEKQSEESAAPTNPRNLQSTPPIVSPSPPFVAFSFAAFDETVLEPSFQQLASGSDHEVFAPRLQTDNDGAQSSWCDWFCFWSCCCSDTRRNSDVTFIDDFVKQGKQIFVTSEIPEENEDNLLSRDI